MTILPTPPPDGERRPIIDTARQALHALNIHTSAGAVDALRMWARRDQLTPDDWDLLVAEFAGQHVDRVSRCVDCHGFIEHVTGIRAPFWRHVQPVNHAARPVVTQ